MANDDHQAGARPLTEDEEWFRDRLRNLLGASVPTLMILAGFLLSGDEPRFSILKCFYGELGHLMCEKALGLVVVSVLIFHIWVVKVHDTHSKLPPHPTVPTKDQVKKEMRVVEVTLAVMVALAIKS